MSVTKSILNNLEKQNQNTDYSEAILNLACDSGKINLQNWQSFLKRPNSFNALAFLNIDSPIFDSLIKYLEALELEKIRVDRVQLIEHIDYLWRYYQSQIAPVLLNCLLKQAQTSTNANLDKIKKMLKGEKLSLYEKQELSSVSKLFKGKKTVKGLVLNLKKDLDPVIQSFFY